MFQNKRTWVRNKNNPSGGNGGQIHLSLFDDRTAQDRHSVNSSRFEIINSLTRTYGCSKQLLEVGGQAPIGLFVTLTLWFNLHNSWLSRTDQTINRKRHMQSKNIIRESYHMVQKS